MRYRSEAIPDLINLLQWLNRCFNEPEPPLSVLLLQLQHLYCKRAVHNQERDSLGILLTDTHSKDAVFCGLAAWREFINKVGARLPLLRCVVISFFFIGISGDRGAPDSFRLNLQHIEAWPVGVGVCAVQISEKYGRIAILLNFLKGVLLADVLDVGDSTHNAFDDVFIRPNHGYLREVSLVLSPLAAWSEGDEVIYQDGFLSLKDEYILVNFLLCTCLVPGLLWDLQKLSGEREIPHR